MSRGVEVKSEEEEIQCSTPNAKYIGRETSEVLEGSSPSVVSVISVIKRIIVHP